MHPTDHIQVVTFQLAGLEPDAYRAHCEAAAPTFTEMPHVTTRDFAVLERATEITRRR